MRARRSRRLRRDIDRAILADAALEPEVLTARSCTELDPLFAHVRRRLFADPTWRYGPLRVAEVAREAYDALSVFADVRGMGYCELGCGTYHPYGISAVMYLNGAASAVALDLQDTDEQRAAEALFDVLIRCLAFPDAWHWSQIERRAFLERLASFDLRALEAGALREGLADAPLTHIVTDIHSPSLQPGSLDLMTSRATLEHFLDFESAAHRMFELMRPGGVAGHVIDLVDHRAYEDPNLHNWSFLAEDDDWSDGNVNRLRAHEIRAYLERAGFEILRYETVSGGMPGGFMQQVRGRFARMTEEQLSITTVTCVLRRPMA